MNINLDKLDLGKADPANMREHLSRFADNCRDAWAIGSSFAIPSYFIKCRKVVFLGMGASGIAGEFLKDLLSDSPVIVECIHNYDLPAWVDSETLVIALSHSGNTEEVLYAFVTAYQKNAKLLAVTTGGRLQSLCSKYRAPIIKYLIDCQPKLAFPYLFIIPYMILVKIGIFDCTKDDFEKILLGVSTQASKISTNIGLAINPAKDLALKLFEQNILIISSANVRASGIRFANSINESGKNFSTYQFLPEINHNLLAGIENPKKIISQTIFILLESKFSRSEIKKRLNITAGLFSRKNISYIRLDFPHASNKLAEILLSVIFIDYTAMYLGFLNQVDPSSAKVVEQIKSELNK